jgi:ribosomal protein S18 acetylase RimI-like enzyme
MTKQVRRSSHRVRRIDPESSREILLVAERMRETLVEVLGEQEGRSMYTLDWLKERVLFHLDPTKSTAQVFLSENAEGEITGHAIVRIEEEGGTRIGLFSTTYVAPHFRRQAIASDLILEGEAWMISHGLSVAVTYTSDSNTKLINLYSNHGYQITESYPEKKMIRLARVLATDVGG